MATMMNYMYQFGLSMAACVAWSSGEHAAAAACVGAAVTSYSLARLKLKETQLGVAAFGLRETGWQTPSPIDHSGNHAGMQGFAARRTRYKEDYENDPTYFDYTYEGRGRGVDLGDGLCQYDFKLSYWLVMSLLPFAVINFCDDRGRHCAFSQLANWSTAEFIIRAQIFTCVAAIVMMDVMVVPPWTTGAGRYTDRPLFFVNSFSVGQGQTIEGMVAYLPESNDPNKIRAALKVMAEVYVRSKLAPECMSPYQVYHMIANVAGFGWGPEKNIGLGSSSLQGICECSTQLKLGGGWIETIITGGDGGAGKVEVKIHPASSKKICELWNVPGARAAADAEALTQFAADFYAPRAAPWEGGVEIITKDDDDEEISGPSDVTDAATPSSEEELTPKLLDTIFFSVSLYAAALKSGEVEEVVTAVGARVDALVRKDASAARNLFEELLRARAKDRKGGPADLSEIWNVVERPSWHPESKGFVKRALKLRKGLKDTTRDVPLLYDDDNKLIYDPSSSNGFQELLAQFGKDRGTGKAHSKFQKTQKLAGSLEAMYAAAPASRRRS